MTTEEVLKALGRYKEESRESDRQTATKLGVNPNDDDFLAGRYRSTPTVYASKVSGFFETRWLSVGSDRLGIIFGQCEWLIHSAFKILRTSKRAAALSRPWLPYRPRFVPEKSSPSD